MKLKYCFECEGNQGRNKLHYWVPIKTGCKCKFCGLEAPEEDAKEILNGRD